MKTTSLGAVRHPFFRLQDVEATVRVLSLALACFDDVLTDVPGLEDRAATCAILDALRVALVRETARQDSLEALVRKELLEVRGIIAAIDGAAGGEVNNGTDEDAA